MDGIPFWVIIIDVFGITISLMINILGFRQIYLNWNSAFIIKRERALHIQFLFCVVLIEIGLKSMHLVAVYNPALGIFGFVAWLLTTFMFWYFIFEIFIMRWLIYYNNNWTLAVMKSKWEYIVIGNHRDNHETNWFIKNKAQYGQYNKIKVRVIIFAVIFCIGITSLVVLRQFMFISLVLFTSVSIPISAFPFVIMAIIVFKTPKFMDEFYIRQESKLHLIMIVIYYVIVFIWGLVDQHSGAEYTNFISITTNTLLIGIFNAIFFISTLLITYKNNKINELSVYGNEISLESVLKNEYGLELFINHLYKEYNIELITSYIEVNYLLDKFIKLNGSINIENKYVETFYDAISDVIVKKDEYLYTKDEDIDTKDDLSILMIHCGIIYTKYINEYSEFTINIPYDIKNTADNMIQNNELNIQNNEDYFKLFDLFYDIKQEMRKMLAFSFKRFKNNNDFAKINEIITNNV